ncbi:uncharacterized protein ASPGLDRAFT_38910 [Aspergillus glaucus CBS 516.65]|uniref:BZIP domain-containing protein n=1 Tax=Aspergillus glaucus CBS 516.65 TaxID=1160497 RepID=A0A1L9V9J3_ASPGL|nr:hypothetical protein ASPGLDRAFT_38910 [Aspergillus glaucus CBS 516.65]OJJ80545.1 hypothetical protein ASPGLDRAFT_38910 [Aspergillus glaucus CBS 516.65]
MADSTVGESDPRSSSRTRASNGGSPVLATTGDPHHHHRTPSLGELHQELEQEQEAQVNRLLQLIRSQQTQLQQLQQQQQSSGTAIVDETTPHSDSTPFPPIPPLPTASGRTSTQLVSPSFSSRRQSRPSSQAASPSLRPQSSLHHLRGPPEGLESLAGTSDNAASRSNSRDECAFYQAEAAMLSRENQMLRQRIRDLERQVASQTQPDSSVDKT